MRAWAITLLLMVGSGCTTAFDKAMRRAEEASAAGDRIGVALAYEEACALRAEGSDVCERATVATRLAVDEAIAQAACEAPDVALCLERLRAARNLAPEDPTLLEVIDAAADRHAERCGHVDRLEQLVPVLGCLERIERQVNRHTYAARIDREARHAAALVGNLPSGTAGGALIKASIAACLGDSEATMLLRERLDAFRAEVSISVWPRLSVSGARIKPRDLCASLPAAARCEPNAVLFLDVRALIGDLRHVVETEERSIRYAAGETYVPNPSFAAAEARRQEAQRTVQSLEPRVIVARTRCDAASVDAIGSDMNSPARRFAERACEESRGLESLLSERQFELRRAESEVSMTPAARSETYYADHRYIVEHHSWSLEYKASVAGQAWSETLREDDSSHPAFAPAGLVGDPLSMPAPSTFTRLVAHRLGDAFRVAVQRELTALSEVRRRDCEGSPRWTDEWMACWAEATFLGGRGPDADLFLRQLEDIDPIRCRST